MVSQIFSTLSPSSSRYCVSPFLPKAYNGAGLSRLSPGFASSRFFTVNRREWRRTERILNSNKQSGGERKGESSEWQILQRWEVPWGWKTVSLISFACGLSFVLTGMAVKRLLGIGVKKLSLDQKAVFLLVNQGLTTAVVLAVIFTVAKTYVPLPRDILRCDLKQPFNLRKGWLVWSGIGLVGSVGAMVLTSVALTLFRTGPPKRERDALMILLPFIGSSKISTLSVVGIAGILAPLLEETVFRGFLMASLTKWVPTPIAIVISSAAFALAHHTPSQFPQLFVLGSGLGLSYAQTRNLITPMIIHGFWNSAVILLLLYLQIKGVDIKALLQQK